MFQKNILQILVYKNELWKIDAVHEFCEFCSVETIFYKPRMLRTTVYAIIEHQNNIMYFSMNVRTLLDWTVGVPFRWNFIHRFHDLKTVTTDTVVVNDRIIFTKNCGNKTHFYAIKMPEFFSRMKHIFANGYQEDYSPAFTLKKNEYLFLSEANNNIILRVYEIKKKGFYQERIYMFEDVWKLKSCRQVKRIAVL
jgi:hypothetical protein